MTVSFLSLPIAGLKSRGYTGFVRQASDEEFVTAKYSIGSTLPGQRGFWVET
jgi:hypothetical protein